MSFSFLNAASSAGFRVISGRPFPPSRSAAWVSRPSPPVAIRGAMAARMGAPSRGVAPMRSTRLFVSTLGLELRIMSRLASCGRNVFNVPTGNGTPPSWSGPGLKPGYGCVARLKCLRFRRFDCIIGATGSPEISFRSPGFLGDGVLQTCIGAGFGTYPAPFFLSGGARWDCSIRLNCWKRSEAA